MADSPSDADGPASVRRRPPDGTSPAARAHPHLDLLARPVVDLRRPDDDPGGTHPVRRAGRSRGRRPNALPADRRRGGHRGHRPADDRDDQRLHHQPLGPPQAVHLHRLRARRRVPGRHRLQPGPAGHRRLRRAAAVLVELRPGAVPGLRPRPRPGTAGRDGQRARRADADPRQRVRVHHRRHRRRARPVRARPARVGHARAGDDARGRAPRPRGTDATRSAPAGAGGRSPAKRGATDVLKERSFVFLVASRLAILMAGAVLIQLALFYLARSLLMDQEAAGGSVSDHVGARGRGHARDHRPGRPALGPGRAQAGHLCVVRARGGRDGHRRRPPPRSPSRSIGTVLYGMSAGIFLAVDWALMTDIIPKAASGRYMGLSNVATASSGVLALAIGGTDHGCRRRGRGTAGRVCGARSPCSASARSCSSRSMNADARATRTPIRRRLPRSAPHQRPELGRDGPDPRHPGGGPEHVPRVRPAVPPRDERPQEDQVVEPHRARPEAEQRLELADGHRQQGQAQRRSTGRATAGPSVWPRPTGSARR